MNVATLVSPSATGVLSTMDSSQTMSNLAHTELARYADASQPDDFLKAWLQEERKKFPTPVLLARFAEGKFSNDRLEALLDLGFDSWIVGQPSVVLVEKICAKISSNRVYHSKRYGRLLLQGGYLSCGEKKVKFSAKELSIFRRLLDAEGKSISREQLLLDHGYKPDTNSHTIETHMYRIKEKMKLVGMGDSIQNRTKEGYTLVL